ncbi:MAG: thiamine-phosphate kinase [Pseudomonadota bacterium]|nr:thiamine-phosphate kinase [Pseudomonadota bacterium]
MTKSTFSEQNIIDLFSSKLNKGLLGDDAVTIKHQDSMITISQDTLNDGVHFDLSFCGPKDIAHRALCANISDMAAMGLTGTHLLQSLSLPPSMDMSWIKSYANEFSKLCQDNQLTLIGGDTCRANHLSITLTLFHFGNPSPTLSRQGALPGDSIFISKPVGGSYLGLNALKQNKRIDTHFINAYLRPNHDVQLGQKLLSSQWVHACMDITDGLTQDLARICQLNQVSADINIDSIPEHTGFDQACHALQLNPPEVKMIGGEDYALLVIGSKTLAEASNLSLYEIGKITESNNEPLIRYYHKNKIFKPTSYGFHHFDQ